MKTAVPGTVRFNVRSEMLIHLDDVVITGPGVPNIGGASSVNPEAHLATTWGKNKATLAEIVPRIAEQILLISGLRGC